MVALFGTDQSIHRKSVGAMSELEENRLPEQDAVEPSKAGEQPELAGEETSSAATPAVVESEEPAETSLVNEENGVLVETGDQNAGESTSPLVDNPVQDVSSTPQQEGEVSSTVEPAPEEPEDSAEESVNIEPDGSEPPAAEQLGALSLGELLERLRKLMGENITPVVRGEVERLKIAFYTNLRTQQEQRKHLWEQEHDSSEPYEPEAIQEEVQFKEVLGKFKERVREFIQKQEAERLANLEARRAVVEKIKQLTERAEVKDDTWKEFNQLRAEWKNIGPVPQAEMESLYESYHHQVQGFYDYIKINQELRDLDYKKNLEEKLALCGQAEDLLAEEDIVKAFKALQSLHAQWKEIGPVAREKSDEIWERFSVASKHVNERHREFLEQMRAQFEENLKKKEALCDTAEAILRQERKSMKEWVAASKEVIALYQQWREIGPVARKMSDKIWRRFQDIRDEFFKARRAYDEQIREEGQENIQKKLDLCVQAEALKESTDWRATAQELIDLQTKWKQVGYTPYKKGNELWERFRAAQNYFFERRNAVRDQERNEQKANLEAKLQIIKELEEFALEVTPKEAIDALKALQARWAAIGFVPFKRKEAVQQRYRELLDQLYGKLRIDRRELRMQEFRDNLERIGTQEGGDGASLLGKERSRLKQQIKVLEADRQKMETNMSFFTSSDSNSPILKQLQEKLSSLQQEIDLVREKVKQIDLRAKEEKAKKSSDTDSTEQ